MACNELEYVMKFGFSLVILVCVFACPLNSFAKGDVFEPDHYLLLDPVVVTARGYATSQSNTPGSVGVVTAEGIELAPKGSLADSLEKITGLARTGDSPWGQDISIRGLTGPNIVILINGKRINTATDMNARLGFINPMDVERIEVLKGPISALYGSGSTGGVINIITRRADFSDEAFVDGRLAFSGSSNPGGTAGYINLSAGSENLWAFASGAYRDYGNLYGGDTSKVYNSQFSDAQGRLMLGLKPLEKLSFTLEALHSEGGDIGIPGGVSSMPAMGVVTYPSTDFTLVSLDGVLDVGGEYLDTVEANLYYTKNERRVHITNIPKPGIDIKPQADHETIGGKVQTIFRVERHTITSGLDFWTWQVESSRVRRLAAGSLKDHPTPDARQTSFGGFIEDDWRLAEKFTLNLGARLDGIWTSSDAFYKVNPPIGSPPVKVYGDKDETDLGWRLHAGLTWKMSQAWSQSFLLASSYRAADIMERYKYINLGGGKELYGNPELDPERAFYLEYGLNYSQKPIVIDLRLFGNIITDYIAEKTVSPTEIRMENVEDARIFGAELSGRWQLHSNISLFGSVAGLYGRNEEKNEPLAGIAPISGTVGIDFTHKSGLWAQLNAIMTAPQHRTPEGVPSSAGYTTVNAAAGYAFEIGRTKHEISLTGDNLFDLKYHNYLANQRGYEIWGPGVSGSINYSVEF